MKLEIVVKVNAAPMFEQSYIVVETRAPQAYDYHGVIQVEDGGSSRIVAIPEDDAPMQTARYQSGMYGASALEAGADEGVVTDLIVARLINRQ